MKQNLILMKARQKLIENKLAEHGVAKLNRYCEVKGSDIAGFGVFATQHIPKDTEIIEYVGELITKKESDKRDDINGAHGEVYLFTLNDEYDIDGSVGGNGCQFINHSCNPNCEALDDEGRIMITALRDIKEGEELSYDYGYDLDSYKDHPCHCGSKNCIGYILGREYWKKAGLHKS